MNFYLPPTAFDVSLVYSNWYVDDRAVLMLNGQIVGSAGKYCYATNSSKQGEMVLTNGEASIPFTFDSSIMSFGPLARGTITSGFILGATNTLECVVNNTGSGLCTPMIGSKFPSDDTMIAIQGQIKYDPPLLSVAVISNKLSISCTDTTNRYYLQRSLDGITWSNFWYFGNWTWPGYTTNYKTSLDNTAFFRLKKY